jgi:hypothetical protein
MNSMNLMIGLFEGVGERTDRAMDEFAVLYLEPQ